ncbi:type VII secretion target [Rhodococcus sp. NPDC078407]|uniref:type VII secretion target n=1 Tax=Rhodococcus sp. NPDC078407 TaxID=3364509 RepID=UPI0037C9F202
MSEGLSVDVVRVRGVADALTASADALGAAVDTVADATFGTSAAGRNYRDLGAAYTQAHLGLGRAVAAWKSSVEDVAVALTSAMNDYERQDDAASHALELRR